MIEDECDLGGDVGIAATFDLKPIHDRWRQRFIPFDDAVVARELRRIEFDHEFAEKVRE